MATSGSRGIPSPPGGPLSTHCSPHVLRSPASGLAGAARFWSPNDVRQARGRQLPDIQMMHQSLHSSTQSPPFLPLGPNKPLVRHGSPAQAAGTVGMTQRAQMQAPASQNQQHAQLLWRSMTPASFVYSCYRPRQTAARHSSTGTRLRSKESTTVEAQPVQERPTHQPNGPNITNNFWPGVWARLADKTHQLVAPQQKQCPGPLVTQCNNELPCALNTGRVSSLKPQLKKPPGSTPAYALPTGHAGKEQCVPHIPQHSVRGKSPCAYGWRPLSVPAQNHSRPRQPAGMERARPSGPQRGVVAGSLNAVGASESQRAQNDVNSNRSASTPPVSGRQSPSLATRIWSLFRAPTEQRAAYESVAAQGSPPDARLRSGSGGARRVVPTVNRAHAPQDISNQILLGWVGNQQEIQHAPAINLQRSRPPSPTLHFRQSPKQQLPTVASHAATRGNIMQKQELHGQKLSPNTPYAMPGCQEGNSNDWGFAKVPFPPQHQQVAQHSQHHVHFPTLPFQPSRQLDLQLQREHFLWQQQQLLQQQKEVLQRQREKLMQQQLSLQQQRQRTLVQADIMPQTVEQGAMPQKGRPHSPHPKLSGLATNAHAHRVSPSVNSSTSSDTISVGADEGSNHEKPKEHAEWLESKEKPLQIPTTAHLQAVTADVERQQESPAPPPPLEWKISESDEASTGSQGNAPSDKAENRKLSFTAVGGSMEQRLKLKCEIIGDPGATLTKSALRRGERIDGQLLTESSPPADALCTVKMSGSLSREEARVTDQSQDIRRGQEPRDTARTEGQCPLSDERKAAAHAAAFGENNALIGAHICGEDHITEQQLENAPQCKPSQGRRIQDRFKVGPHDLIPVGPFISAISYTNNSRHEGEGCATIDECTEDSSYIEAYLPIKSLAELESFDKGQGAEDLLDVRRDIVGCGTYGVVRKLRHRKGGFAVAVKSIQKETVVRAGMVNQVEFELYVQRDLLRHQNVLRCFSCVEDAQYLHMVLGYCDQGDLYRRIREQPNRRFSELEAFCFFAQLVNGLHCVHSSGIIHRDLKLENLLLTKGNILKIADFGWCGSIVGHNRSYSFCGTLDYLAPEMVKGQGHDWRVDLWSLGVLLYELLDGRPPFQSTRHFELVQRIVTVDIRMPSHVKKDAADLIEKLLKYNPSDRLSLVGVAQHPWVFRMWKELQIQILQQNPYVDLEALVPVVPTVFAEVDPGPTTFPVLPNISTPTDKNQEGEVGNCSKVPVGKGSGESIRNGTSRLTARSPAIHTRQYQAGEQTSSFLSTSSRKHFNKLSLDRLSRGSCSGRANPDHSAERTTRKGPSTHRNSCTSSQAQPRRPTFPKATPSPTHIRSARSTSKGPGNIAIDHALMPECPGAADTSSPHIAQKKNMLKARHPLSTQKSKSRRAPLLDQSFDLPSATRTTETSETSPLPSSIASTACSPKSEPSGKPQQRLAGFNDAKSVFDGHPQNQQGLPVNWRAKSVSNRKSELQIGDGVKANALASRHGVTFYQNSHPQDAAFKCTTLDTAVEVFPADNDATSLPSLKKVRSVSTNPHTVHFGATLRMRSNPNKAHVVSRASKSESLSNCRLRIERDEFVRMQPSNNQNMAASPNPYIDGSVHAQGSKQGATSKLLNASDGSTIPGRTGFSVDHPLPMASIESRHKPSHWPETPQAQLFLQNSCQWYSQQAAQPVRTPRLQQFQGFVGKCQSNLRWCRQVPEGQLAAVEATHAVEARQPRPHASFQTAQKQELINFVSDPSALHYLYCNQPLMKHPKSRVSPLQSEGSPTCQGFIRFQQPPTRTAAPGSLQFANSIMEPSQARGLPIVVPGPEPRSPKFVSNPSALFS
ncbi:Aurora kinase, putative [Eimeria necatrix]|uniref:Aurora kinase, putative n=1 Tax=Eimeria necatrix TaxID=51315 RepID=U6MHM8_9EIME|nr:Aurora kinase, putative [Eimeria necatrix]CDJ63516.1 Aurora kinase, putative [Eimeria necatrix]